MGETWAVLGDKQQKKHIKCHKARIICPVCCHGDENMLHTFLVPVLLYIHSQSWTKAPSWARFNRFPIIGVTRELEKNLGLWISKGVEWVVSRFTVPQKLFRLWIRELPPKKLRYMGMGQKMPRTLNSTSECPLKVSVWRNNKNGIIDHLVSLIDQEIKTVKIKQGSHSLWTDNLHEMSLHGILPQIPFIGILGVAFSNSSLREEGWQKHSLPQTTLCTLFF